MEPTIPDELWMLWTSNLPEHIDGFQPRWHASNDWPDQGSKLVFFSEKQARDVAETYSKITGGCEVQVYRVK